MMLPMSQAKYTEAPAVVRRSRNWIIAPTLADAVGKGIPKLKLTSETQMAAVSIPESLVVPLGDRSQMA
jgi:hypothetical protein